ncbi:MAG: 50S ribosomal protein L16 [Candidatus Korarchaeota archaeon]|nr:50S ribosomal protein L16 [Candidatus Korarchaeota archaeon]NIU82547.1 50S ribosomal protein L16 [Candidatus Thorarchaeota archaeon]NIW13035.1 50S ribosomal protein L16 [Candidatus Thorarchaeota archaeon]NIW51210.1 50S ribosomal protein L16 [Candidatus Korarchaeota archaeon]
MPTKRPARSYREAPNKPYTRHEYVKSVPESQLRILTYGKGDRVYEYRISLISGQKGMILSRCLEACRTAVNRYLERNLKESPYFWRFRTFPHHIVRERRFLGVAGADRIQSGMRLSFGNPVDRGAIIHLNQPILELWVNSENLVQAKEAVRRGRAKIGLETRVEIEEVNAKPQES